MNQENGLDGSNGPEASGAPVSEALLDAFGNPFCVIDAADRRVLSANKTARERGIRPGAPCHRAFYEHEDPCHAADRACPVNEVAASREPVVCEHAWRDAEGRTHCTEIHAHPLLDDEGRVTRLIMYSFDVTRRRETEEQLRKLSLAVSQSPVTIVITDTAGSIEYANPMFEETTGYRVEEALGKNPRILKSGRQSKAYYEELWQTITSGRIWRGEFQNRRKNGEIYWERASISPLLDETGAIAHFVGVKEDITATKRLLEELQESRDALEQRVEERTQELEKANAALRQEIAEHKEAERRIAQLAAFPEENPNPVGTCDAHGQVLYINPATERVLDALGVLLPEILPERFGALAAHSLERGQGERVEHTACGRVFAWRFNPLPKTGVVHFYIMDITEQRRAENELLAERANLEETVDLRTRQLRQSLDELEEANRHKSRFLSSMSHELRTPLTGILGFVDLLRQQYFGPLNAKQIEYAELIERSGKHLLALINDLLDIAKIDAGRMDMFVVNFPPCDCIDAAVAMCGVQLEKKRHEVVVDIAPELDAMTGDLRKCKQIMLNLLSNAIKYTDEGGRISIAARKQEDGAAVVEVTDTGVGIEADKQARIFSEFYQADHVRDQQMGGTGIGLALTRRLVEMHGGQIGVRSQPGEGSTFWFRLPAKPARRAATAPEADGQPDACAVALAGRRVLLVEDNEVNQAMLLDMLGARGVEAALARNGQEAVDLAQSFRPELVLMDLRMPVLDGLEATRRLRRMPELAETPIIAVSASADADSVAQCMKAGCTGHLPKPVERRELYRALERYLAASEEEA